MENEKQPYMSGYDCFSILLFMNRLCRLECTLKKGWHQSTVCKCVNVYTCMHACIPTHTHARTHSSLICTRPAGICILVSVQCAGMLIDVYYGKSAIGHPLLVLQSQLHPALASLLWHHKLFPDNKKGWGGNVSNAILWLRREYRIWLGWEETTHRPTDRMSWLLQEGLEAGLLRLEGAAKEERNEPTHWVKIPSQYTVTCLF